MKTLFTLLLSVLLATGVSAQKLPRIKILATGGTIAGKGASADRAAYTAGELPIKDLIGAVPGIEKVAALPKTDFRIFGKPTSRPYRRMGVALTSDTLETSIEEVVARAKEAAKLVTVNY